MIGRCREAVACVISAMAACSSAPIRYYSLAPPSDAAAPAPSRSVMIDVRMLHVPSRLDRRELMVRTGPAEIALLENERWASPVKDEIRDALRLELQRRLGANSELRTVIANLTITVDVQRFEAELGRHALMEASWSVSSVPGSGTGEGRAATCAFRDDEKIAAGYSAMINGYQRNITALADAVVAELKRRAAGIDAPCGQTGGS